MAHHRVSLTATAVLTLAALTSQTTAAELAAPQKTTTPCTTYDHLPPVCGYVIQLTPDELRTVQGFHEQNVEAYQNFKITSPSRAAAPKLPAPKRTATICTTFDNFPPVCGFVAQLTPDELKVVQDFHHHHVEAYQNFKKNEQK